jgi:rSAM/selenodomain-associated transferase 1
VDKVDNSLRAQPFTKNRPVICVFAKQPIAGQVKTRLTPPLSADEAAALYRVAMCETIERLRQTGFRLVLCYAGQRAWFAEQFPYLELLAQIAGGLGERLIAASTALFTDGDGPVVMVGTDSPDLPVTSVEQSFARLQDHDAVSIPCRDGGYALIGLRQPQPGLFEQIPWSTDEVLAATRQRVAQLDLDYCELSEWEDLDDMAALQRLMVRSPRSATARYLASELADHF